MELLGGVVLFVDTLAVEEICCHRRIMSAGFVRPKEVASTTIVDVQKRNQVGSKQLSTLYLALIAILHPEVKTGV